MPTPWSPRVPTVKPVASGRRFSEGGNSMVSAIETGPAREVLPEGPRFGLATETLVGVSSMVGTGVLTTSGLTVYFVGSNQLMLALWVVGGVLALCGALTLCELSAALPRSGGDYVFLSEAYGPLAGFLSG